MKKIDQLRKHLLRYGSITKLEAGSMYFIFGLKEQLNRLKFENHEVITVMIPRVNKQAYGKYTLVAK